MTAIALDASTALSWCFEDEGGPETDAMIEKVAAEGAGVPGLWSVEIANGLVVGERRGRESDADVVDLRIETLDRVPPDGLSGIADPKLLDE